MTSRTYVANGRKYTSISVAGVEIVIFSDQGIILQLPMRSKEMAKLATDISQRYKLGFRVYKNKHDLWRVSFKDDFLNYSPGMVLVR